MKYDEFIRAKGAARGPVGFKPTYLPDCLFPFQRHLCDWSVRLGRAALFEGCGLGKSLQSLVWAENVLRRVPKSKVLILTPLAVGPQFVTEADKFGMKCAVTRKGEVHKGINVTNYERLHYYNPKDFAAVVVDEVGAIKAFDGKRRREVTDFISKVEYRLLCSATPAPNDFMELGSSAEALGVMTRNQMLAMFFTNDGESTQKWRLKGHAKKRFWQWVATWARAVLKPSDLGYDDGKFTLPGLRVSQHIVPSKRQSKGFIPYVAKTLHEQRRERRETLRERCERVASLVDPKKPAVIWCHLNAEGNLLEKLIPGAVEVAGCHPDDVKEQRLTDFTRGRIRVLVSKPRIAGFGLNWQHCSRVYTMASYSWEAYYQSLRRCYRFGQEEEVECHVVSSSGERLVVESMLRKERQSDEMYRGIVREMNSADDNHASNGKGSRMEVPSWLSR